MSVPNNAKWKEFIEIYRSFPELWKPDCENYKNKNVRYKAWKILLEKYKEIEESGTIELLKKKINNLRTCYRRELKKLMHREKYASASDVVYKPSLWYFESLNFLRDNIDDTEFEDSTPNKRRKIERSSGRTSFIKKEVSVDHFNESKEKRVEMGRDEATVYAESWAVSFRKLNEHQKLFAKKAIEEILILGQLDQLTLNSVITPEFSETEYDPCHTEFQFVSTSS